MYEQYIIRMYIIYILSIIPIRYAIGHTNILNYNKYIDPLTAKYILVS